jgi:hypothetical protein
MRAGAGDLWHNIRLDRPVGKENLVNLLQMIFLGIKLTPCRALKLSSK